MAQIDVMNFGAKADGKADLNQPLSAAWKQACASASPSKIVIPEGEFMLSQVTLEGPCKAPLEVQVGGNLKAPTDPSRYNNIPSWVTFQRIDHLTLSGPGTFDGQGLTFTNMTITAPDESPNTDGIHIGRSNEITITDSMISTGNDCVSLGGGSQNVTVRRVTCGPGHGISVGSLGKYKDDTTRVHTFSENFFVAT
ncbi:Glycoside hydrolase, family 28 [Corchorus capsularis]|uniref:Glycoside hydrolase, family 28 n=1 Tax=Corchorus capsularis TaxID=210143 RepID=A0A1R3IW21_COCAP|nr:Glycoside hydrolase, family 28 [Corchorus capsularis]